MCAYQPPHPQRPARPSHVPPLLQGLNKGQLKAALAVRGPVQILAGAGTGKTRTIAYRIANQVLTKTFQPDAILAVTFTERAAKELRERLHNIGITQYVRAVTFHAAAWAQVRYFWKYLSDKPVPSVLLSKSPHINPIARKFGTDPRDLLSDIEWANNMMLSDSQLLASTRHVSLSPENLVEARQLYTRSKQRANEIDYLDMMRLCIDLLDTPAKAEIIHKYQAFTVDEFQDANLLQWSLLTKWVERRNDVCVVGDPAQAIYGFNGGDAKFLQQFPQFYPGTTSIRLNASYRSSNQILEYAHAVLPTSERLHSAVNKTGPSVAVKACKDEDDEIFKVTSWLKAMQHIGVPWHQMAILVRLNAHTPMWEEALLQVGIPSIVLGEGSFFQRRTVRAAVTSLAQVYEQERRKKLGRPPLQGVAVNSFEVEINDLKSLFYTALQWRETDPEPAGRQAQDRYHAIAILYRRSMDHLFDGWTTSQVLEAMQARLWMTPDDLVDAVSICTLHRSKGMEYTAVAIPHCEEGLIPMLHSDRNEENRLLYVGITRARKYLCISHATTRIHTQTGRAMRQTPSPFIIQSGSPRQPILEAEGGLMSGEGLEQAVLHGRRNSDGKIPEQERRELESRSGLRSDEDRRGAGRGDGRGDGDRRGGLQDGRGDGRDGRRRSEHDDRRGSQDRRSKERAGQDGNDPADRALSEEMQQYRLHDKKMTPEHSALKSKWEKRTIPDLSGKKPEDIPGQSIDPGKSFREVLHKSTSILDISGIPTQEPPQPTERRLHGERRRTKDRRSKDRRSEASWRRQTDERRVSSGRRQSDRRKDLLDQDNGGRRASDRQQLENWNVTSGNGGLLGSAQRDMDTQHLGSVIQNPRHQKTAKRYMTNRRQQQSDHKPFTDRS